jgi:hypothetical protein
MVGADTLKSKTRVGLLPANPTEFNSGSAGAFIADLRRESVVGVGRCLLQIQYLTNFILEISQTGRLQFTPIRYPI